MYLLDGDQLEAACGRLSDADATVLRRLADAALEVGPFSPCDKPAELVASSGDPRDYVSFGPYWWPDPDQPDGLPWVRHDGEVNPETQKGDRERLQPLIQSLRHLTLGWFYLRDERYAAHAVRLIDAWWLDPETRMNPHMHYAQAIPGKCEGRGIGLIDTNGLPQTLDMLALLDGYHGWTDQRRAGLRAWVEALLDWMLTSAHGQYEREHPNNHGTYCYVQIVGYARFTGRDAFAQAVLDTAPKRLIAAHVEPDGSQPREIARTKGLAYSTMNALGLALLARMGERQSVDLWGEVTEDGRSIRRAIDFLVPYLTQREAWPWQQIDGQTTPPAAATLLRLSALAGGPPEHAALAAQLRLDDEVRVPIELAWPLDGGESE